MKNFNSFPMKKINSLALVVWIPGKEMWRRVEFGVQKKKKKKDTQTYFWILKYIWLYVNQKEMYCRIKKKKIQEASAIHLQWKNKNLWVGIIFFFR